MEEKEEFHPLVFEKKLAQLKDTQESIQGLSSWCLKQREHHKKIVQSWLNVLKRVKPEQRLVLFYLANDVIQYSKRKNYDFVESWGLNLQKATPLVRDEKVRHKILRIFKIWEQRGVYDDEFLSDLTGLLSAGAAKKTDDDPLDFQPQQLVNKIKQCTVLEADTDLRLRYIHESHLDLADADALCTNLKDRSNKDDVEKELNEGIACVERYTQALQREIVAREALLALLTSANQYYSTQRGEVKVVAYAYKNFGARVRALKRKLDELIPTLPGGAPSPPQRDEDVPSPGPDEDLDLPGNTDVEEGTTRKQYNLEEDVPSPEYNDFPSPEYTDLSSPEYDDFPSPEYDDFPSSECNDLPGSDDDKESEMNKTCSKKRFMALKKGSNSSTIVGEKYKLDELKHKLPDGIPSPPQRNEDVLSPGSDDLDLPGCSKGDENGENYVYYIKCKNLHEIGARKELVTQKKESTWNKNYSPEYDDVPSPEYDDVHSPEYDKLPSPEYDKLPTPEYDSVPSPEYDNLASPEYDNVPSLEYDTTPSLEYDDELDALGESDGGKSETTNSLRSERRLTVQMKTSIRSTIDDKKYKPEELKRILPEWIPSPPLRDEDVPSPRSDDDLHLPSEDDGEESERNYERKHLRDIRPRKGLVTQKKEPSSSTIVGKELDKLKHMLMWRNPSPPQIDEDAPSRENEYVSSPEDVPSPKYDDFGLPETDDDLYLPESDYDLDLSLTTDREESGSNYGYHVENKSMNEIIPEKRLVAQERVSSRSTIVGKKYKPDKLKRTLPCGIPSPPQRDEDVPSPKSDDDLDLPGEAGGTKLHDVDRQRNNEIGPVKGYVGLKNYTISRKMDELKLTLPRGNPSLPERYEEGPSPLSNDDLYLVRKYKGKETNRNQSQFVESKKMHDINPENVFEAQKKGSSRISYNIDKTFNTSLGADGSLYNLGLSSFLSSDNPLSLFNENSQGNEGNGNKIEVISSRPSEKQDFDINNFLKNLIPINDANTTLSDSISVASVTLSQKSQDTLPGLDLLTPETPGPVPPPLSFYGSAADTHEEPEPYRPEPINQWKPINTPPPAWAMPPRAVPTPLAVPPPLVPPPLAVPPPPAPPTLPAALAHSAPPASPPPHNMLFSTPPDMPALDVDHRGILPPPPPPPVIPTLSVLGQLEDVDHRLLPSLPPPPPPITISNRHPNSNKDVDHRNLISLTHQPAQQPQRPLSRGMDTDYRVPPLITPSDIVESVDMDLSEDEEQGQLKINAPTLTSKMPCLSDLFDNMPSGLKSLTEAQQNMGQQNTGQKHMGQQSYWFQDPRNNRDEDKHSEDSASIVKLSDGPQSGTYHPEHNRRNSFNQNNKVLVGGDNGKTNHNNLIRINSMPAGETPFEDIIEPPNTAHIIPPLSNPFDNMPSALKTFNMGQQNMLQQNIGQEIMGHQNMGQQNMGQQNMGQQNIGLQNMGHQNMGHQNMGQKNMGQKNMGQQNYRFNDPRNNREEEENSNDSAYEEDLRARGIANERNPSPLEEYENYSMEEDWPNTGPMIDPNPAPLIGHSPRFMNQRFPRNWNPGMRTMGPQGFSPQPQFWPRNGPRPPRHWNGPRPQRFW